MLWDNLDGKLSAALQTSNKTISYHVYSFDRLKI
jgi:hypothetical protein